MDIAWKFLVSTHVSLVKVLKRMENKIDFISKLYRANVDSFTMYLNEKNDIEFIFDSSLNEYF